MKSRDYPGQHPFSSCRDGRLKSQIAANRLAEKRLEEIVRYGRAAVEQAIERIFIKPKRAAVPWLLSFPTAFMRRSPSSGSPRRQSARRIKVRVIIQGRIDNRSHQCSPQRRNQSTADAGGTLVAYKP
jgi:hypothetical protein